MHDRPGECQDSKWSPTPTAGREGYGGPVTETCGYRFCAPAQAANAAIGRLGPCYAQGLSVRLNRVLVAW